MSKFESELQTNANPTETVAEATETKVETQDQETADKDQPEIPEIPQEVVDSLFEKYGIKKNHIVNDLPSLLKSFSSIESAFKNKVDTYSKEKGEWTKEKKQLLTELEQLKQNQNKEKSTEIPPMPDPVDDPKGFAEWMDLRMQIKEQEVLSKVSKNGDEKPSDVADISKRAVEDTVKNFEYLMIKELDSLPETTKEIVLQQISIELSKIASEADSATIKQYFDQNYWALGQAVPSKEGLKLAYSKVVELFRPSKETTKKEVKSNIPDKTTVKRPDEEVKKENTKVIARQGAGSFLANLEASLK